MHRSLLVGVFLVGGMLVVPSPAANPAPTPAGPTMLLTAGRSFVDMDTSAKRVLVTDGPYPGTPGATVGVIGGPGGPSAPFLGTADVSGDDVVMSGDGSMIYALFRDPVDGSDTDARPDLVRIDAAGTTSTVTPAAMDLADFVAVDDVNHDGDAVTFRTASTAGYLHQTRAVRRFSAATEVTLPDLSTYNRYPIDTSIDGRGTIVATAVTGVRSWHTGDSVLAADLGSATESRLTPTRDIYDPSGGIGIGAARVSADGRVVYWTVDMVSGPDVLRRADVGVTGEYTILDTPSIDIATPIAVSGDGARVVFRDTAGQVHLFDATCLADEVVTRSPDGSTANGSAGRFGISADGTWLVFDSTSSNLLTDGTAPAAATPSVYARMLPALCPTGFVASTPARLVDTRFGGTTVDGRFAATGAVRLGTYDIAGRAGLPFHADAAALNVTVSQPSASGYAQVWSCPDAVTPVPPVSSNLNFTAGQTTANSVLVPISTGSRLCVRLSGATADVIVDVSGYLPLGSSYLATTPQRVLETRTEGQRTSDGLFQGSGIQPAGATSTVRLIGRAGIPIGAIAAVVNVTSTGATGSGYLTVWSCDDPKPAASVLNHAAGRDTANLMVVPLGASWAMCLQTARAASHLVVDVLGYFSDGSGYSPLAPARLLDSRAGASTIDGIAVGSLDVRHGRTVEVPIAGRGGVPVGAAAAVLNLTAASVRAGGYATVWPCATTTEAAPNVSNLGFDTFDVANLVVTPLSSHGTVCVVVGHGAADLILDVTGWFAG